MGTAADLIDNLEYDYTGNRLDAVHDNRGAIPNSSGYEGGGNTISYDVNGNMIDMRDKGITAISYNYLNLPTRMDAVDGFMTINIGYVYRADGTKLRKTNSTYVPVNNGITTESVTDYLDGFQYLSMITTGGDIELADSELEVAMEREAFLAENKAITNPPGNAATDSAVLQFVPTAEGFYDFTENKYIYQYKDHLGNTRLSYAWNSTTSSIDVLDRNDYYPFGMNHLDANAGSFFGQGSYKNYKYNGKELQETGMYDYGFRQYMPDIGRWGVVDPLAEVSRLWSPYTYAYNNPIRFIDPDGMLAVDCPDCPNPQRPDEARYGSDGKYYTATPKTEGSNDLEWVQTSSIEEVSISPSAEAQADYNISQARSRLYAAQDAYWGTKSDAYSISIGGNADAIFISGGYKIGIAVDTRSGDIAIFGSGSGSLGLDMESFKPGISGGFQISDHNTYGNESDVIRGLAGKDVGRTYSVMGQGYEHTISATENFKIDSTGGVESRSVNIGKVGVGAGIGQSRSSGFSINISESIRKKSLILHR